ncbi:MAG: hypothetical protein JXX14_20715 [Deltaproteobacteria bacterium]|nr:hypothetical protein [Deltaproteobacteria bacterium]
MKSFLSVFIYLSLLFTLSVAGAESAVSLDTDSDLGAANGDESAQMEDSGETLSSELSSDDRDAENSAAEASVPVAVEEKVDAPPVFSMSNENVSATTSENSPKSEMQGTARQNSGENENAVEEGTGSPVTEIPPAANVPPVVFRRAEPAHNRPFMFGLGIAPGGEHGYGAVFRFRTEHVSFDTAYGVLPVLISYYNEDTEKSSFDFALAPVHVDGGVAFFFGERKKGFQDGVRTQGIFNSIMGPGAGLGWTRERQCSRNTNRCWKHFVLGVGSGIKVFPRYAERIKSHFGLADNEKTSPLNIVQMYLSVTLMWYP